MATSKGNSSNTKKRALIIGNDTYTSSDNGLKHSVNNANDLCDSLKKINFTVTIKNNPNEQMMNLIKTFAETVNDGDCVLFYYSGHACHANRENYLIPINDSSIETDEDIPDYGCSVKNTLDRLVERKPSYIIFILDCCRPYKLKNVSTSAAMANGKGLLEIQRRSGVFIQLACVANQAGSVIRNTDRNCLFAKHLLNNITEENVNINDIFRTITCDIYRESNLIQRPLSINGLQDPKQVYLRKVIRSKTTTSATHLYALQKLALIIGNGNYNEPHNRLNHSINNANDLSNSLNKIGFDLTLHTDPEIEMMKLIRNFVKTINDGDLILFYFSGHSYQLNGKTYLIPIYDRILQNEKDVEEFGIDIEQILTLLTERNPSHVNIVILDCCRVYKLKNVSTSNGNGLLEIRPRPGIFIQFACATNEIVSIVGDTDRNCLFAKHLLRNITKKNVDIVEVFRRISDDVYEESKHKQKPLSVNGLNELNKVYLNEVTSVIPNIPYNAIWKMNAQTIAGSFNRGYTFDRLHYPKGLCVDRNRTIFVADSSNHRIMKYRQDDMVGRKISFKNIYGYGPNELAEPSNVILDRRSTSLIISDCRNRRVLQRFQSKNAKILIGHITCGGITMDDEDYLYVSDTEQHEVRRYRVGNRRGTVVAGGRGQGSRLSQLNHPTYICVGPDESVYVSDSWNDRVVKWAKGASEGVIVAGGKGKGQDRTQLDYPTGLIVDQLGTVYIADHRNHRVMRWYKDASQGESIAGDRYVAGDSASQLNGPEGLAFDTYGNLYVVDSNNHRIQRFNIITA